MCSGCRGCGGRAGHGEYDEDDLTSFVDEMPIRAKTEAVSIKYLVARNGLMWEY